MFCVQCGQETVADSKFCGHCGATLATVAGVVPPAAAIPPLSPSAPTPASVSQVCRPWVRYWARMFDIYVAALVGGIVVGIVNPHAFDKPGSDQLFALVVIFLWVFVESIFLSTSGKTPGKWLLKTRVVPSSGSKPSYSAALSRSFKVWWRGLGVGFPIASLITLIVAHGKLTKNGVTSWDKDDSFTVVHERIGAVRITFAIIAFAVFFVLMVIGNAANA